MLFCFLSNQYLLALVLSSSQNTLLFSFCSSASFLNPSFSFSSIPASNALIWAIASFPVHFFWAGGVTVVLLLVRHSFNKCLNVLHQKHFPSFISCEAIHIHHIWVSFLLRKRESSGWGLLTLCLFISSSSKNLLHPFEVILKSQGFFKPFFKSCWRWVTAWDLFLKWEWECLPEEVDYSSQDWDLGLQN